MCFILVTHTRTSSALGPYPRWPVLYPSARHFLLVDDVHELHGVVALHVHHRPLQGILGHLVELKERGGDIENAHAIQRLTFTRTF